MAESIPQGLSETEAQARRARGQGNAARLTTSRSYLQILRQKAFTFINTVLFAIGVVLLLMGRSGDALVTAGLVLMNVVVDVYQEGRAKRKLDQIALLTRPKATVLRDGQARSVDPSEIVLGDVLRVGPGDQVVVDGQMLGAGKVDVDESLLTGESDLIPKRAGDGVYSGSFVVTGDGYYEAQKVGAESMANQLTAQARAFRQVKTPLQRDVGLVMRALILLATPLLALLGISFAIKHTPIVESVQVAAVIVALVPQGLSMMTTVTYAMGAVRIAGKGALIQQANALESLSHVNTLCLDKTGTLTTSRIRWEALHALNASEEHLRRALGGIVANTSGGNRTSAAIAEACPDRPRRVVAEAPFSSARKWSAVILDDEELRGLYVLGAPEVLLPHVQPHPDLLPQRDAWAARGLRVLLLAHDPGVLPLTDSQGEPQLPAHLIPLGMVSLSDELRAEAGAALQGFREAHVDVKIISGDNPQTVAALARQAGLGPDVRLVSGLDLAQMDAGEFARKATESNVFGRITPQQKEDLVRALRDAGQYVAMIGDGVNDVLSLKQAHLGIAMQSGSQATRGVADMVLLNDSFGVLPAALREGQRIVRGMEDIARLFLARTFYVTLIIIGCAIMDVAFPVTPKHNSILALLTVGLPTLALSAWARPGRAGRSLIRAVSHFVFPAAFSVAVLALGVYLGYLLTTNDVGLARTLLTTTTVFCGLMLIPLVEPPTAFWVGGDELSGDWRPTILAGIMALAYLAILYVPGLRQGFELQPVALPDLALVAGLVAGWAVALRALWRGRVLERMFGEEVMRKRNA